MFGTSSVTPGQQGAADGIEAVDIQAALHQLGTFSPTVACSADVCDGGTGKGGSSIR